jgi:hypothetical protein
MPGIFAELYPVIPACQWASKGGGVLRRPLAAAKPRPRSLAFWERGQKGYFEVASSGQQSVKIIYFSLGRLRRPNEKYIFFITASGRTLSNKDHHLGVVVDDETLVQARQAQPDPAGATIRVG